MDRTEAVRWFRLAAAQGNAKAQNYLGVCYLNGEGVAVDHAEAVRWFRLAAEQGYATAQLNLGVCYCDGDGVAVDHAEAVRWYRLAAALGNAAARGNADARHVLERVGVPEPAPVVRTGVPAGADDAEPDAERACIVCMVNRRRMVIADCGHLCLCFACARMVTGACPLCRVPIRHNMIKIFY
jgi:TPR repeat protein